jgi:hypothetical protein
MQQLKKGYAFSLTFLSYRILGDGIITDEILADLIQTQWRIARTWLQLKQDSIKEHAPEASPNI